MYHKRDELKIFIIKKWLIVWMFIFQFKTLLRYVKIKNSK